MNQNLCSADRSVTATTDGKADEVSKLMKVQLAASIRTISDETDTYSVKNLSRYHNYYIRKYVLAKSRFTLALSEVKLPETSYPFMNN